MALNVIKDAITALLESNADSAYVIKNGENVALDEVRCIYNSEIMTIWQKQKYYYIAFNVNGGTGKMDIQTMSVGVAAALAKNLFNKLGYLFGGWSDKADGEKLYDDGQTVTDIAAAGATRNLYALWTAITWYVKFNANGGNGNMSNQAHRYDASASLTANAFYRDNHSFIGWATSPSGAKVYSDKQLVANLASTHGGIVNLYAKWAQTVTAFAFNGGVQAFTVPADGTYQLEVYGAGTIAQNNCAATYGGYAKGNAYLKAGDVLYICVGGTSPVLTMQGQNEWTTDGGYNGGGQGRFVNDGGYHYCLNAGGGATHIAKNANRGELANYASHQSEILIVAGGAGGSFFANWYDGEEEEMTGGHCTGGSGGGTSGGAGETFTAEVSAGGSQTAGGIGTANGSFGQGGSYGGGSGWYGGGAGSMNAQSGRAAGGGSGYIGGVSGGSMQNGVQSGDGYAKITFLG